MQRAGKYIPKSVDEKESYEDKKHIGKKRNSEELYNKDFKSHSSQGKRQRIDRGPWNRGTGHRDAYPRRPSIPSHLSIPEIPRNFASVNYENLVKSITNDAALMQDVRALVTENLKLKNKQGDEVSRKAKEIQQQFIQILQKHYNLSSIQISQYRDEYLDETTEAKKLTLDFMKVLEDKRAPYIRKYKDRNMGQSPKSRCYSIIPITYREKMEEEKGKKYCYVAVSGEVRGEHDAVKKSVDELNAKKTGVTWEAVEFKDKDALLNADKLIVELSKALGAPAPEKEGKGFEGPTKHCAEKSFLLWLIKMEAKFGKHIELSAIANHQNGGFIPCCASCTANKWASIMLIAKAQHVGMLALAQGKSGAVVTSPLPAPKEVKRPASPIAKAELKTAIEKKAEPKVAKSSTAIVIKDLDPKAPDHALNIEAWLHSSPSSAVASLPPVHKQVLAGIHSYDEKQADKVSYSYSDSFKFAAENVQYIQPDAFPMAEAGKESFAMVQDDTDDFRPSMLTVPA